jgi:organic anion transporter 3A
VKVYIDEKYHHASDPNIRPSTRRPKITNPLSHNGAATGADGCDGGILPAPLSAPGSKNPSRASTLVRQAAEDDPKNNYGKDIKDIPKSMWKLLTNKIYIVTCLGACMELIIVSGFIVFLPKYLETQFNLSKSMASMFTGGIAIPGACIGIFMGGYILKRLQLKPKGAAQLVVFFNVLCLGCYVMLFFFGCENIKMAGTTMPYSHKR